MNLQKAISQLDNQGQGIICLAKGMSQNETRWKPDPQSWSVLEVLNHLVDEEVLDFRCHLEHILHTPNAPWPKIDPEGWVTEKAYNERSLDDTILNFQRERQNSIAWLSTLNTPDWDVFTSLPYGNLRVGDMLASWLAHDLLHIRQLVELRYALTSNANAPYHLDYAGEW
jgi:hypothetical protein